MRRAHRAGSRDLVQLAQDLGRPLPSRALSAEPRRLSNPFQEWVSPRGHRRPEAGWAAVKPAFPVYRMTSDQAGGVWPLIASDGMGPTGALIGLDWLSGSAFHCDPVGWTLAGAAGVTNPNMIVFGAPGQGKSATVKVFCLRMMAYGYRVLVLGDVKDEYEQLCCVLGAEPHAVGVGLPARINPLDLGPLGQDWSRLNATETRRRAAVIFARWLLLMRGLVGSQHVPFGPSAETAVGAAMRDLTGYARGSDRLAEITIPQVWRALDEPSDDLISACRYAGRQHFLDDLRPVRDALGTLVRGHLAGLFDDRTTISVDWHAPIQSLSLSRLEPLGDEAVGVALTCLNSWGRAMTDTSDAGDLRIVVRDEAWKQMRLGPDAVKSLDADLRLSRRDGCVQLVVAHKPSDMLSVGDQGSQAVAIAKDLIHLCSTKVLLGQDERVADDLAQVLGLNPLTQSVVTQWATGGRGRALWLVGNRAFKVQTLRSPSEIVLTDTGGALRGSGA